ncbi:MULTISPECIES: helix-turn-helix domain-containing protein [unclassified Nocardiopsis]|uniref:AraC-like ligand-binding domain-containing protein n=1 Tax=Nocardiopsis TaxID=2013 RepID=UPI00387B1DB2
MEGAHTTDRLDRFEAEASRAFAPMRMRSADDRPFRGSFTSTRVDDVVLTRITAEPILVRRGPSSMSSTDPELFKVAWHVSGRAGVAQNGRECLLSPGDLVVYETGRPYELPFWEPAETIVVGVPQRLFGSHAALLRGRTAVPVRAGQGLGGVLGALFQGVSDDSTADLGTGGRHHLAAALVSLVCAAFADAAPAPDDDPWERIRAYCLANLADPALSAESIARAHGISTRYLYKLCAERGFAPTRWIRGERLARIRRDLADPALADRGAAAIAARWGVLDAAHLGRMLRAEFGETVPEIRARARA